MRWIDRFLRDEEGQDIIEYGLLAFLISIIAVLALKLFGPKLLSMYSSIASTIP